MIESASTRRDKKRFRKRLRAFSASGILKPSLDVSKLRDGPRYAAPSFGFGFEAASSGFAKTIVFRAAVIFGRLPERGNPTFFFHSCERESEPA